MTKQPHFPHLHLPIYVSVFFFVLVLALCQSLTDAFAANQVSGRYLSASGTNIVLSLSIQTPSPTNFIVEQYLSPGNIIIGTSPTAKKINTAKSNAKWIFRNSQNGNISLSIRLQEPLKGSASAVIRYSDPKSGAFTELRILP